VPLSDQLPSQDRAAARSLLMLLALAFVLRCGVVLPLRENLTDDRDIYLALAEGLRESRGLSVPGTDRPTAFRPPLYPLLLAATTWLSEPVGVAMLNVLLGVGTVSVTFWLGLRLGLTQRSALLAGGIVAVDPLLLLYTTFPMTETLCAFLAAALLLAVTSRIPKSSRKSGNQSRAAGSSRTERWRGVVSGVMFGLCVLSRPTFWVFGGLMAVWFLWTGRTRRSADEAKQPVAKAPVALLIATLLVVVAWPIRNYLVLDAPVFTTTHGGYTILLGNNPAFYQEVVMQPLGTVWDGSRGPGQQAWAESVNDEMDRLGVTGEVASDRWMSARARENIGNEPATFFRACLLRFVRFWNIVPSGSAAEVLPRVIVWIVGCCYLLLFAFAVWGLAVVFRDHRTDWGPALLLIVSFTLVHLVYWSNARMRAPVMPAVALLAAAGVAQIRRSKGAPEDAMS
jgi:hypothetical protein